MGPWLQDIEALEQVSQDDLSCRIVLRLAQLSREGRLRPFVSEVAHDAALDAETRDTITELAEDESFLLAVEDYLARTGVLH